MSGGVSLVMDGWEALLLFARVGVLLAGAWMIAIAARRGSAAVRYGVWAAGLLGALVMPGLHLAMPAVSVEVPSRFAPPILDRGEPAQLEAAITDGPTAGPNRAGDGARVLPEGSWQAEAGTAGLQFDRLASALVAAWLMGALGRLSWVGLHACRAHRRLREDAVSPDARTVAMARAVAEQAGVLRTVRVVQSPSIEMPLTWGAFRPVVVLPLAASAWPDDRLRVTLLHELAHVRRFDYATSLLAEIACAAYWPLPLVWLARERMRVEQERSCDDRVLASGAPSLSYAEHLLAVARDVYGRAAPGVAVAMARKNGLKSRVQAILDEGVDRRPFATGGGARSLLGLAVVGVLASGLQPEVEPAEHSASPLIATVGALGTAVATVEAPAAVLAASEPAAHSFVWLEAENGLADASRFVRTDLDASEAAYVRLEPRDSDGPSHGNSALTFQFRISQPGDYVLWVRAVGGADVPLWLDLESSPGVGEVMVDAGGRSRGWNWAPATPAAGADDLPVGIRLDSGEHRLTLRSAGRIDLDRVLLTTARGFRPSGHGPRTVPIQPISLLVQAEDATLTGRTRTRSDRDALNGRYLVFRDRSRTDVEGVATFTVDLDEPGRYLIWGRVLARGDDANSFHVSVDGGEDFVWDAPSRRTERSDRDWRWDPVSARKLDGRSVDPLVLELAGGTHVIRVRTRESGTQLDALLVTNDLTQRPRQIIASLEDDRADPPRNTPAG